MKFLQGKKTYLTMLIIIMVAGINGWNDYCATLVEAPSYCVNINVPEWVFAVLASLGIYTRSVAKPKL
jgi:hypothetical protein